MGENSSDLHHAAERARTADHATVTSVGAVSASAPSPGDVISVYTENSGCCHVLTAPGPARPGHNPLDYGRGAAQYRHTTLFGVSTRFAHLSRVAYTGLLCTNRKNDAYCVAFCFSRCSENAGVIIHDTARLTDACFCCGWSNGLELFSGLSHCSNDTQFQAFYTDSFWLHHFYA